MDSHEVSETETDYIITFTMFSSSTEEVDGFIINGDEAILTLGRKEFIGIGEISSFSGGYMQIVYFLPYQIKTVDANMEHELVNGGIRVKLDESSLTNPTLKVTMDRTKVVENLDEKFNSYDGNVNSNNGKSTVSKNVKKDTEEESEGSSLIDWAYDNFGGVLELLPGDRKTKFYIFAAAVVFIVLKLFSGGKKE